MGTLDQLTLVTQRSGRVLVEIRDLLEEVRDSAQLRSDWTDPATQAREAPSASQGRAPATPSGPVGGGENGAGLCWVTGCEVEAHYCDDHSDGNAYASSIRAETRREVLREVAGRIYAAIPCGASMEWMAVSLRDEAAALAKLNSKESP
jgi:hypothetical protein